MTPAELFALYAPPFILLAGGSLMAWRNHVVMARAREETSALQMVKQAVSSVHKTDQLAALFRKPSPVVSPRDGDLEGTLALLQTLVRYYEEELRSPAIQSEHRKSIERLLSELREEMAAPSKIEP